jgi:hypothetical protein
MKATAGRAEDRPGHMRLRVEVEFQEQDVRLRETRFGVEVELAGARATGEPGGPALPRAVIAVALPPFHWPASIEVEERSLSRWYPRRRRYFNRERHSEQRANNAKRRDYRSGLSARRKWQPWRTAYGAEPPSARARG